MLFVSGLLVGLFLITYGINIYEILVQWVYGQNHGVVFRGRSDSPKIALTFDDVPYSQTQIQSIAEILSQHQAKATCFVIGSLLRQARTSTVDTLRRYAHILELANHGMTDRRHGSLNESDVTAELVGCECVCQEMDLPLVKLYRPGCGLVSKPLLQAARATGNRVVLGDIYSNDPWLPIPFWHWLVALLFSMTVRGPLPYCECCYPFSSGEDFNW